RDTALVLEAQAAEAMVARGFPGLVPALQRLRRLALAARPPLGEFAPARRPLERLLRSILEGDPGDLVGAMPSDGPPSRECDHPLAQAERLLRDWSIDPADVRRLGPMPLYRDWWTGELRPAGPAASRVDGQGRGPDTEDPAPVRSARMERRPEEREATADEDRG